MIYQQCEWIGMHTTSRNLADEQGKRLWGIVELLHQNMPLQRQYAQLVYSKILSYGVLELSSLFVRYMWTR